MKKFRDHRQFWRRVCQNYHQDSEAAINRQINLELYASCMYLSLSATATATVIWDTSHVCNLYHTTAQDNARSPTH
uniref:Ferritin-like diiron domain-containing protein n=2 Tax=Sus scrofa TaxID=9823 RepID=A0A8D1FXL8_PIG